VIADPSPSIDAFDELFREVMREHEHFGHRQHVHVTWLAIRRFGTRAAIDIVSAGIQRTARYAGAPQKYNATVSRAWVELTARHMASTPGEDFDDFIARNPDLLDKRLLTRFYAPATLATPEARAGWVEPDRRPFTAGTETTAGEGRLS
jgi:hypothetical protein